MQATTAAVMAQTDLQTLFVTDGTNFFVRREVVNEGTGAVAVTFTDLAGAAPRPWSPT